MNHSRDKTQTVLGNIPLSRIGYGAMRLPGIRDVPRNDELAHQLLTRAVELGVNTLDTADFYGEGLANRLIADASHPYTEQLIIATKVGVKLGNNARPEPAATNEAIKRAVDNNLESLRTDSLDLVFLRLAGGPLADSGIPVQASISYLADLREQGLIKHIGLSSATPEQFEAANSVTPIEAIQNAYSLSNTNSRELLERCHDAKIPFLAYFPMAMGKLAEKKSALSKIASKHQATEAQIALAWLLKQSPMMIPIPGTAQLAHLQDNSGAQKLTLSAEDIDALTNSGRK